METDFEKLTTEELRDLFYVEIERFTELQERILEIKMEVESRGENL